MAYQNVEIISNTPELAIPQAIIFALLQQGTQQAVGRGEVFTGRQSTRIIHNEQYVIKLRFDFRLLPDIARRWVRTRVQQELTYQIYHPQKTWFLWFIPNVNRPLIANITPRMQPLHLLTQSSDAERLFLGLQQLLTQYLTVFQQQKIRLDEGLSNFAFHQQDFFYLDDDTYDWDDGVALSSALALWLRSIGMLSEAQWQALGVQLREGFAAAGLIDSVLFFLANELESAVLAPEKEAARSALLSGLRGAVPSVTSKKTFVLKQQKIAFFADIHANMPALTTILKKLQELDIQQAIVLGDIVGYGHQAAECIELLQKYDFLVMKGNHDHAAATDISMESGYSQDARSTLTWARQHLTAEQKSWLADLPSVYEFDQAIAVHGAPMDRRHFYGYVYRMTYEDNLAWLKEHGFRFAFHGHSHIQGIYFQRDEAGQDNGFDNSAAQSLNDYTQALICPGSCGWPRDGRPGAQFCVFDRETLDITFYHLDYPYQDFSAQLAQQGVTKSLILRLETGH